MTINIHTTYSKHVLTVSVYTKYLKLVLTITVYFIYGYRASDLMLKNHSYRVRKPAEYISKEKKILMLYLTTHTKVIFERFCISFLINYLFKYCVFN